MADVEANRHASYHDDASDVDPDDSASRHGPMSSPDGDADDSPRVGSGSSSDGRPADSHVSRSAHKDAPSTPPSRHPSHRSSQTATPTTFVPSKKDRVRYSWQSILEDEPNRPRINIIKIVSNTATASAAFPQGEALAFSLSPAGKRIAAYNSARLFVFQTAALPVNLSHEYALPRRPMAVEVCDDANILAVLADEHTINIYDLSHNRACRLRTVRPDLPTNTIALSSTGGLLAVAYEGGVEVFSLASNALVTDRRAVRAPRMDKLVFSQDDSTLLGTTTRIFASNTVVVSVPVFPSASSGAPSHQELKEAWCSGMLEPQNIRNSSHATFMREGGAMNNEKVFSWNGLEDTFGILSLQDMVYSHVDFPVAISPPLSTCGGLGAAIHHAPSIDEHGNIAAMIVNDRTVRLYIVPRGTGDGANRVEAHSIDHELDEEYGCPFTELRWVHSRLNLPAPQSSHNQIRGRLVVTSPGGLVDSDQSEHVVQDVEGGRIILFDFDPQFAGQPGQTFVFSLGKAPPLTLDEEHMDVAAQVALVRRRTVTSNRSNTLGKTTPSLGRAATTVSRRQDQDPAPLRNLGSAVSLRTPPMQTASLSWRSRRNNAPVVSLSPDASRSLPDLLEATELDGEPIEEPYIQGAPRSVASLHRAATAVNAHRFQALEENEAETEHPGDLPLPAYTELPNQPLPGRYRALAGLEIPSSGRYLDDDRSPVSALASAPPTFDPHHWPSSTTQTLPQGYTVPQGVPRPFNDLVSPVSMAPSTVTSDWSDASPDLSRAPTHLTLRTQPSWETVSTSAQTQTQPPSVLRSQPSWESNGALSFFSPEMRTTGSRTAPSSPEQTRPGQVVHGLGLHSFRHSLLLPDARPFSAASEPTSRNMHRPPHVNAFHAVNHATTTSLTPSNNSGERRSGSSTGGVSAVSANSRDVTPTSAGAVAYPVTGWYPPAPNSPPGSRPSMSARSKTTSHIRRSDSIARSDRRVSSDTVADFRPAPTLHRSKSIGAGRKAWFAKKKSREEAIGGAPPLPKVGVGVREDLIEYEAQGKRCVVM